MFALADRLRVRSSSARCMRRRLSHAPNRIDHRRSSARRQRRSNRPKANHRANSIQSPALHVMPWRPPFPNSRDGVFSIACLHGAASVYVGQRRNRAFGPRIFTSSMASLSRTANGVSVVRAQVGVAADYPQGLLVGPLEGIEATQGIGDDAYPGAAGRAHEGKDFIDVGERRCLGVARNATQEDLGSPRFRLARIHSGRMPPIDASI